MFYEAPKRRTHDRIAATSSCAHARLEPHPDPDADPTAALLLHVEPLPAPVHLATLLALATDAARSPR